MGALIACRRPAWVAEAARFALRSGAGAPTMAEHFDLVIRGGTLVDGTGAPARPGDVAIRDGRIAALGAVPGAARRVLDAEGAVVAPGFVDIHTHYDAQVFWDRMLTISPWHGVTSVVMGNCGFGVAPTRPAHRDLVLRTLAEGGNVMQATLGPGLFLDEFAAIQQRTGRPVSWTALLGGMLGPDGHRAVLEQSAAMQARGIRVIPQVSCRPLMVEFNLQAPFPLEPMSVMRPVSRADAAGKRAIYADAGFRRSLREKIDGGRLAEAFRSMQITEHPPDPSLAERRLGDMAAERGVHPVDLALDLSLASGLATRFRLAVLNTDEAVVAELLRHPASMLGLSDAGAHASQLCDACAPTELLGRWVREKSVLSLEEAVRRLTAEPAEVFGITDRGRLAPGLAADVTVFDPATVGCRPLRRVYDFPAGADRLVSDAVGVRAVVVNGVVIREDGRDAVDPEGPLPGRVLRGGHAE